MTHHRFSTYVIGAERPVGHFLTRLLAAESYLYKAINLEVRERLAPQAGGRPFMVITPSMQRIEDFAHVMHWLEVAKEDDIPVIVLSSLALFGDADERAKTEQDDINAEHELADALLVIEQAAREHSRHIIVRQGQTFSMMADDFATDILTQIRTKPALDLDNEHRFNPTAADDVAQVLLAIMKQAACSEDVWGTYHCCGVEPITTYGFAEALLSEARQYEDLGEVTLTSSTSGFMPAVWAPVGDNTHLFHTFGIRTKPWRKALSRLLKHYYRVDS
ncbi:MAG: sugar nucleotide-binding protein [Bacterioplanes sp.]|nr:sugar nucleotide-binding protein [Bacterioplanes sp.]